MERLFELTTQSQKGLTHLLQECTWDVLLLDQDTEEALEIEEEIMIEGAPALTIVEDVAIDLVQDHILAAGVSILLADVTDLTLQDVTNIMNAGLWYSDAARRRCLPQFINRDLTVKS